ncbi:MAG: hypothetical protein WBN44_12045 [Woeseiaceae bacterium]
MIDDLLWFLIIFVFGWVLALVGGLLGWAYRKPGITMSVLMNGYTDEPTPKGLSQPKRMLSYVRDDKRNLVSWVIFVAELLLLADVVALLVVAVVLH